MPTWPGRKTAKIDEPHEIWQSYDGTWEWRVLKKNQADDKAQGATWMCAVKSPHTHGSWDYGDTYAADVMQYARRVA